MVTALVIFNVILICIIFYLINLYLNILGRMLIIEKKERDLIMLYKIILNGALLHSEEVQDYENCIAIKEILEDIDKLNNY